MPGVEPFRAVLYARISEDATGEAAGVTRQLADARQLAEARGYRVVAEHTDNDVSALRGKHRPGYSAVLDLVGTDAVDAVVVWQTSRLLRNRAERAAAIELLSAHRVSIVSVRGADLDLSSAYGRGMAGLLGEFDTMESEVKSERVAAAAAHRARSGLPDHLGFGWHKHGAGSDRSYTVKDDEAAVVREVTDRLLAGETLAGITVDLNNRGVAAPEGGRWGKSSVRKLALRPSNAALRLYHRGRPTAQRFPGRWPALVSEADWQRVTGLITDPARVTSGNVERPGARRHLLTYGCGECGTCGGPLRVARKGAPGAKASLYVCEQLGCVGRSEHRVDDLVRAVVTGRLARPDALGWLAGDDEVARAATDAVTALRARLDDAADSYADGKIDRGQLTRITARMRPQLDQAEAEHRRALRSADPGALLAMAGPEAAARWDAATVAQRRTVLTALGLRVLVMPTRKGPGFRPEDVRLEWAER